MKHKIYLLLFVGLISCSCLLAKSSKSSEKTDDDFTSVFSLGMRFGSSYSKMHFNPSVKQKRMVAPFAGIVLRYQSEHYAAITMEINYVKKGWVEDLVAPNKYNRRFTAITVPLMTTIIANLSKSSKMNFGLGPQMDYILNDAETEILYNMEPKPHYGLPVNSRLLFSFVGSIQYELATKLGSFCFDVRYGIGLSDIFPNHSTDLFANSQFNLFSGSVIYLIPWKKFSKHTKK